MGKGSTRRPGNEEEIRREYDRIFPPKPKPTPPCPRAGQCNTWDGTCSCYVLDPTDEG